MKISSFLLSFFALFALLSCKQPENLNTATEIQRISEALGGAILRPDSDSGDNYYKVNVPFSTNLADLNLNFVLSEGASYEPQGARDFSGDPVEFTVTAEDNTISQIYIVRVEKDLNTATEIQRISEALGGAILRPDSDSGDNYYKVNVPFSTNLADLNLNFVLSEGASYEPQGARDFSGDPVEFTVTAEDNTISQIYIVRVEKDLNTATEIQRISEALGGAILRPDSDFGDNYYKVNVPSSTNLADLNLNFVLSEGASYEPQGARDFSGDPVEFTVTAEDNTTSQIYIVRVEKDLNTATEIQRISEALGGAILRPDSDSGDNYYKVNVPSSTNLADLNLNFVLSEGASYEPQGARDFSGDPVEFTVTAEDNTTSQIYIVRVEKDLNTATEIQRISEALGGAILRPDSDSGDNYYKVNVPFSTNLADLNLNFVLSEGASYEPQGARDFSGDPVEFTVTAEDNTISQIYIVRVEKDLNTATEIQRISEALGGAILRPDSDSGDNYYKVNVPFSTNLADLNLNFVLSEGASYEPQGARDFSGDPVEFTVTAEDNTTSQIYIVRVERFTPFRVIIENDQWVVADPQDKGTHTGIWKIDDLARVGTGANESIIGGNVWQGNNNYVLMQDLDFTVAGDYQNQLLKAQFTPNGSGNKGWDPIGEYDANNHFNGEFEGNRKTISNLYINRPHKKYSGLFESADENAVIKQLGLLNVNLKGKTVGGLVGTSRGSITQTYVMGQIDASIGGGIVGLIYNGTIEEAYSTVTVTGSTAQVGGLVGKIHRDPPHNLIGQNSIVFAQTIKTRRHAGDMGRISSNFVNGSLRNNYANDSMHAIGFGNLSPERGHDTKNGADISAVNFKNLAFYGNLENFNPLWNFTDVWVIKENAERPTFIGSSDPGLLSP